MKKASTYFASLFLLIVFSFKIGTQLLIHQQAFEKAETEQQEEKSSEEKAPGKTFNAPVEYIDLMLLKATSDPFCSSSLLLSHTAHASLPVQYFAIPTPPPWNKA